MAAQETEKGKGRFERIKGAVQTHSQRELDLMFNEATAKMLHAVSTLIDALRDKVNAVGGIVEAKLRQVFSVTWERAAPAVDPAVQLQIRRARDAAIHAILPLRTTLDRAMLAAGIARAEPDVEMTDVQVPRTTPSPRPSKLPPSAGTARLLGV